MTAVAAFLGLERIRVHMERAQLSFAEAREALSAGNVFTTHTPVPAGSDEFPLWLIDKYLQPYYSQLDIDRQGFIDLALNQQDWGDTFSMIVLALRMSEHRNGVSDLHGHVARQMWSHLWPDQSIDAVQSAFGTSMSSFRTFYFKVDNFGIFF